MARTDYGAILSTVIKDTSDSIREVNGTNSLIAPSSWGTAIRTMHSDSDYENALEQMIEETASGAIASFTDGADNIPVKSLTVEVNPVQSGTGDPSPSNVRPICGWSACKVTRTGANIWEEEWEVGSYNTSTGAKTTVTDRIRCKNKIAVRPNVTYCIRASAGGGSVLFYGIDGTTFLSSQTVSWLGGTTFTTPSNCYFVTFMSYANYGTTYNNDISINYPSTDTSYHAYTGTTATIPLGSTYYGATINPLTGEGNVTHKIIDLTENTWNYGTSGSINAFNTVLGNDVVAYEQCYLTNFTWQNVRYTNQLNDLHFHTYTQSNNTRIAIRYDAETDPSAFKMLMNGAKLVIPLATPVPITFTPIENINTLLGDNNIFADTGDVEVVYRANGELYVAQHT